MTHDWILADFFGFFVILCRTIGLMALMPFLSHIEINSRSRFMLMLGFAYLIKPVVSVVVTPQLSYLMLTLILLKEIAIGAFIGLVARLFTTILDIAGTLISAQIGLSSATSMNPNMQGSSLISMLLSMFGVLVFLNLNLHHLVLTGFYHSYALFPVDAPLMMRDMSDGFVALFAKTFWFGVQIAFPFVIAFLVMQVAFGLLNRMVPQMQIFFVSLPFQLWAGLMILMIVGGTSLISFAHIFEMDFAHFFKLK